MHYVVKLKNSNWLYERLSSMTNSTFLQIIIGQVAYIGSNTIEDVIGVIERALLFIILLRVISGSIEISAAALMYKFNDLEKAFYINSMLALVGPVILIVTTGLALSGLTEKISLTRMVCLFAGISLILFSLKAK